MSYGVSLLYAAVLCQALARALRYEHAFEERAERRGCISGSVFGEVVPGAGCSAGL